jgi:glycosyltransferase involved in cell wall biosynthesis
MEPILSIAIPTKDRYETLFPVLEALLKHIAGSDYEIVVQDNTSENGEALEELAIIMDDRIRYFHVSEKLTVTENSHLAISHCTGEYITFIGDDDLISPYILEIVQKVKLANLDCLIYERGNYFWKDLIMHKKYAFHYPASMQFPKHFSTCIEELSINEEMSAVLDAGGIAYLRLPSLYHGLVKRESMLRLQEVFGTFVPGSCPDIAIATALSGIVNKYGFMRYPVTITGASKKSAAGMGVRSAHIAKIEDVPWLPKNLKESWDPKIPGIWTGMTIYAQNIHEVFQKTGAKGTINYGALYSNLFIKEPKTRKIVWPLLMGNPMLKRKVHVLMIKALLFDLLYKAPGFLINLRFWLKGDFKRKSEMLHVNNVDECMEHLVRIAKPEACN